MRLGHIAAFVKLGRPRFLAGGFVLYAAGAALVRPRIGELDVTAFVLGQCAVTATQLMTHYANDYFDLEADRGNRASTRWSGGSRVLVDGSLAPRVARGAALTFGAAALSIDAGIALALRGSTRAVAMLTTMLALSWSYSAPPLRLHSRGLGGPTAAIVVGALTPLVGAALQREGLTAALLLAVAPLALAQLALILILDLPDAGSDGAAGKRTVAVRFGTGFTARLVIALVALTYALVLCNVVAAPWVGGAMLATAPFAVAAVSELRHARSDRDASRLTGRAVFWFGSLALSLLAGAWLAGTSVH